MTTTTATVELTTEECVTCGTAFGVPSIRATRLRQTGEMFYCPNGHQQGYVESDVKRLTRDRDAALAGQRVAEGRAATALVERDEATKQTRLLRERIVAGLCPC